MKSILHITTFVLGLILLSITTISAQNLVLSGGGMVVEDGTFLVIQGNIEIKTEVSDGKIDLNGSIMLQGDITNSTSDNVFSNQESTPNGWVLMQTASFAQRIKGITPIAFENLSLMGSEKILENNNSSSNGIVRLNAIFNLNKRNFILNNKSVTALEHTGGYLFAETTPSEGIGSFQWQIPGR